MTPLEPRQVPPHSISKWCKEAAKLVKRDIGFWFMVALFFSLCTFFALRSFFVSSVLMLTCFYLSVCLAKACDANHSLSFKDFSQTLRENFLLALMLSLYQISTYWGLMLVVSLFSGTVPTYLFYSFSPSPELSTNFYDAMQRIFVRPVVSMYLAVIVTLLPLFTSAFHFHLMAFLGVSFWQAKAKGTGETADEIFSLNIVTITLTVLAMFGVSMTLLVTVPFLAPLGCSFSGALSYVMFREIYLGRSSNVPRTATAHVTQQTSTNI